MVYERKRKLGPQPWPLPFLIITSNWISGHMVLHIVVEQRLSYMGNLNPSVLVAFLELVKILILHIPSFIKNFECNSNKPIRHPNTHFWSMIPLLTHLLQNLFGDKHDELERKFSTDDLFIIRTWESPSTIILL